MKMMKKLLLGLMMVTMTSQMMATGVQAAAAAPLAEPDYMITSPAVSGDGTLLADESDLEMAKLAVAIEEMNNSTSDAPAPALMASTKTGTIVSSVNLRKGASTSSSVIRKLSKGEKVTILDQPDSGWYKVKDSKGNIGYMSSSSKYIKVNGSSGSDNNYTSSSANARIEKVIQTGYKYLGTPYEYGSDRNTTKTFDCSDFVRHIYKTGAGITLPSDSRSQGSYVKSHSTVKKNISSLKRGDLMFFGKYRGTSKSDYKNVNKSNEKITHVGVYLGDGKILHTYSKESGGVRVDKITGHWEYRFLYGGSVIK